MRRLPLPTHALPLLTLLAAGGCQLVAGVRTDAEPATGGAGSTSASSDVTTTADSSSASSMGGAGPCMTNAECTGAGSVCVDGACVTPACTANAPIEIFGTADLGNDVINESEVAVAYDGTRIYVAVVDYTQKLILVRPVRENSSNEPVKSAAFLNDARLRHGRWQPNVVYFQGVINGRVADLQWETDQFGLVGTSYTVPWTDNCDAQDYPDRVTFSSFGVTSHYLAVCEGTTSKLVLGDGGPGPTPLGSGPIDDPQLHIQQFVATDNAGWLAFVDADGKSVWRGGKAKADLAVAQEFSLGSDGGTVATLVLSAGGNLTGDGFVVAAVRYKETPPIVAELWTGDVKDLSTLGQIPPPAMTKQFDGGSDAFTVFGESSEMVSSPVGYFFGTRTGDHKRATVTWLSPKGQLLVLSSPAFITPDSNTAVNGVSIVMVDGQPFVVWTEKTGSAYRVRGASYFCAY